MFYVSLQEDQEDHFLELEMFQQNNQALHLMSFSSLSQAIPCQTGLPSFTHPARLHQPSKSGARFLAHNLLNPASGHLFLPFSPSPSLLPAPPTSLHYPLQSWFIFIRLKSSSTLHFQSQLSIPCSDPLQSSQDFYSCFKRFLLLTQPRSLCIC